MRPCCRGSNACRSTVSGVDNTNRESTGDLQHIAPTAAHLRNSRIRTGRGGGSTIGMSMNDIANSTSRTSGRWTVRYVLVGPQFADGAAERMPVATIVPTREHADRAYADAVECANIMHITVTDPDGVVINSARTDAVLPPEAHTGTALGGYGYNEYDQVTHTDGSVWYVRSLTVRIFPNGERALAAVNVTDQPDRGRCNSFPASHVTKTGDGSADREFCPHGQRRNHTTIADTDDITGDGHLHCRCCHSAITGGHQTETHRINL